MKKFLSILLSLTMCLSIFATTAVQVFAANGAENMLSVTNTEFKDNEITYTINLKTGIKALVGTILKADFDSSVLKVKECKSASTESPDGDLIDNVAGIYEFGAVYNNPNQYAIGYMNTNGFNVATEDKEFITITFQVISDTRPLTKVDFVCEEFITDDNDDTNDIRKNDAPQVFFSNEFLTLNTPKVKEVSSLNKALKASWDAVPGAESYVVYRKTATTSWMEIAKDVKDLQFTDTTVEQGVEYYYSVAAANSFGATDYEKTGVPGMDFGSIESIETKASPDGINVIWSALKGAETYDVYRKAQADDDTAWTKIANVKANEYEDLTAESGVYYNYKVKAIQGRYTADMSAPVPTVRFIAAPVAALANTSMGIELRFNSVNGAEKYIIERKTGAEEFKVISTIPQDKAKYEIIDGSVNPEEEYVYRIQAVSADISSVKRELPAITRLATPVLDKVKNSVDGVELSWNSVKSATKYDVYRGATADDLTFLETVDTLTYVDKDVKSGETYVYTVSAKNETGVSEYDDAGLSITYLASPIISSVANTPKGIRVIWSAVPAALTYDVYRAAENEAYIKLTTTDLTEFVDSTAEADVQYKYTVVALSGEVSSARNENGVKGMSFGTVKSIDLQEAKNSIKITWAALTKAEYYEVYRREVNTEAWTKVAKVTKNEAYDTTIDSGVKYEYTVKAVYLGNVSETDVVSAPLLVLFTPNAVVKNIYDGIYIKITPVNGATSYKIEKFDGQNFVEYKVLDANSDLTFIDTQVEDDSFYKYRIVATNGVEVSGAFVSAPVKRVGTPKITHSNNEIVGVAIVWPKIPDAERYEIYRRVAGQKEWGEPIKTYPENFTYSAYSVRFLDGNVSNNVTYEYTVNAILKTGGETGYDEKGTAITFVETPDLIKAESVVNGIKIQWHAVDGCTSYRVYRRGAGTDYWYYLGNTSRLDFTDKSSILKNGEYYRYTVIGVNDGTNSAFDKGGLYTKYVATPKLTSITNVTSGIRVNWTKVPGAIGYRVYRRGAGQTSWKYLGTTKNLYYVDTEVRNLSGQYYRYTVRADSYYFSGFDTNGITIKRLANPVLSGATSARNGITVKWKPVNGTTGYYVYRKTSGSNWQRIGTVGGTKNTTFLDKKARKGTTYTYTVRACYGRTLSSYNSKGVSCKDKY